jgi:hypothetical protein
VAFSGTVQDDNLADVTYTEEGMNHGIREKELPEKFAIPEYQVLLVAEKYQTGFDQPLLHTIYVDKRTPMRRRACAMLVPLMYGWSMLPRAHAPAVRLARYCARANSAHRPL